MLEDVRETLIQMNLHNLPHFRFLPLFMVRIKAELPMSVDYCKGQIK